VTRCHQVDSQLGPPGLPESAKKKTLSVGSRSNPTALGLFQIRRRLQGAGESH